MTNRQFAENTGWRQSGSVIDLETTKAEEAIISANLDWEVEKQDFFYGNNDMLTLDNKYKAIVRRTDNKRLGVVKKGYQIIQNTKMFSFMDDLARQKRITYHSAGSFREDSSVWLLSKIDEQEIVPNDSLEQYILLYNSHDGSSKLRAALTTVRVLCENAVLLTLNKFKKNGISVRHTKNCSNYMDDAVEVFHQLNFQAEETTNKARVLSKIKFNLSDMKDLTKHIFPDPPKELKTDRRMNNLEKKRNTLLDLYLNGQGQDTPGVPETGWAAYNGVTEYFNHHTNKRGEKASQKRLEDILFGTAMHKINAAEQFIFKTR
jgi:phage/plasmid-like protein (TIGR03299 family)